MTGPTSAASSPRLLDWVVPAPTADVLGNDVVWGGQAYDAQRDGTRKPWVSTSNQAEAEWGPRAQDAMALLERYSVKPLRFEIKGSVPDWLDQALHGSEVTCALPTSRSTTETLLTALSSPRRSNGKHV
jgi:hypothetical protein